MNEQITVTHEVPNLPEKVEDAASEKSAAEIYAKAESILREIEEQRVKFSKPTNDALKAWNNAAKKAAAPFEEVKEKVAEALSAYRLSPPVQEKIAALRRLEKEAWKAQNDGDLEKLALIAQEAALAKEEVGLTVPVTGGSVRFRQKLTIEEIDESVLAERYFIRVPDKKLIEQDIESMGTVSGVRHSWSYSPAFYGEK